MKSNSLPSLLIEIIQKIGKKESEKSLKKSYENLIRFHDRDKFFGDSFIKRSVYGTKEK